MALKILKEHVKNKNLIKHMLATEAIMCELAKRFNEDEHRWSIAGLLHDLDYDQTINDFKNHRKITAKILKEKNIDNEIIDAIEAHPGHKERNTLMAKALYAVDPLTGLIVACALIHPDKKLNSIDKNFILKRFKEKRFAAGANREQIQTCSELGLSLEEFVQIGLNAMQKIHNDLGL